MFKTTDRNWLQGEVHPEDYQATQKFKVKALYLMYSGGGVLEHLLCVQWTALDSFHAQIQISNPLCDMGLFSHF